MGGSLFDEFYTSKEMFWTFVRWMPNTNDNESTNLSQVVSEIEHSSLEKLIEIFQWIKEDEENIRETFKMSKHDFYLEMFKVAIENNYIKTVSMLISKKMIDPSDNDNWAIRVASRNGNLNLVKLLIRDKRVDPSSTDNWAIKWSSFNNYVEVVEVLLRDKRVNPSIRNNLILKTISKYGHVDIVMMFLNDKRVFNTFSEDDARHLRNDIDNKDIQELLQRFIKKKQNEGEGGERNYKMLKSNITANVSWW
jgi:hypothetical protein